jgi:hypothetical protein
MTNISDVVIEEVIQKRSETLMPFNEKGVAEIVRQCEVKYTDDWDMLLGFSDGSSSKYPIIGHLHFRNKINILEFENNVMICEDFNLNRLATIINPVFYSARKMSENHQTVSFITRTNPKFIVPAKYGYEYIDL